MITIPINQIISHTHRTTSLPLLYQTITSFPPSPFLILLLLPLLLLPLLPLPLLLRTLMFQIIFYPPLSLLPLFMHLPISILPSKCLTHPPDDHRLYHPPRTYLS